MDKTEFFAMYFAGLVSMQYHPRNKDEHGNFNVTSQDIYALAEVAKTMVGITMVYDLRKE